MHPLANLDERWTGDDLADGVYWWILYDSQGGQPQKGGLTIRRD